MLLTTRVYALLSNHKPNIIISICVCQDNDFDQVTTR